MPKELPEDYFDKLPDKIFNRIDNEEKDVDQLGEVLSSISKVTPYKVPQGYFNSLTNRIVGKQVGRLEGQTTKVKTRILKPWLSIAAALTVILMYTYSTRENSTSTSRKIVNAEILNGQNLTLTEEEAWKELIVEYTEEELWEEAMIDLLPENETVEEFLSDFNEEELDQYLDILLSDLSDLELASL